MSIIEKSQEAIRKILGDKNKPEQYANYLKTIDRLAKVRARLPGRIPGTISNYTSGKISTVGRNVTNTGVSMSRILQSYQDRALRIAQAKYYQKQAKA
tara:strand:+ start:207 stop:500 length:294 start_codon:yes stop_codon:yes gene_type:complete